jgi:hypothetical protein
MADESPGEDLPARIAGSLERIATRIRSFTVDPIARFITYVTLGLVAITLVGLAFLFFLVGLFRISGELIHKACGCTTYMEITYAVVGGVFLALGALIWSRRLKDKKAE